MVLPDGNHSRPSRPVLGSPGQISPGGRVLAAKARVWRGAFEGGASPRQLPTLGHPDLSLPHPSAPSPSPAPRTPPVCITHPHLPVGEAKPSAVSGAPGFRGIPQSLNAEGPPLTPCQRGGRPTHSAQEQCPEPPPSSAVSGPFCTVGREPRAHTVPGTQYPQGCGAVIAEVCARVSGVGCVPELQKPEDKCAHPRNKYRE